MKKVWVSLSGACLAAALASPAPRCLFGLLEYVHRLVPECPWLAGMCGGNDVLGDAELGGLRVQLKLPAVT